MKCGFKSQNFYTPIISKFLNFAGYKELSKIQVENIAS